MSTTTVSPAELEEFRDATVDAGNNAESTDTSDLEEFVKKIGPHTLGHGADWAAALDIAPGAIANADRDGELMRSSRKADHLPRRTGATIIGYRADSVLAWIEKKSIPYRLTSVACAMVDATADEAVRPDALYTCEAVASQFGIPLETITNAVLGGKIRTAADPNIWASTSRIEGGPFLDWIRSEGITIKPSFETAKLVARLRQSVAVVETSEPKPRAAVISTAAELLETDRATEAAAERASHAAMMAAYRDILMRRDDPQPNDANTLVELCKELGYSTEKVEADAAVLDRAAELKALDAGAVESRREVTDAGTHLKATRKRCKDEVQAAERRIRAAFSAQTTALSAPAKLESLKRDHPELFA